MLLICAEPSERHLAGLTGISLSLQEGCRRVTCAVRRKSGTVLLLVRGNVAGSRNGGSIVCAGASGIGLKHSKISSFVNSVAAL
jgi:hypothetical protein